MSKKFVMWLLSKLFPEKTIKIGLRGKWREMYGHGKSLDQRHKESLERFWGGIGPRSGMPSAKEEYVICNSLAKKLHAGTIKLEDIKPIRRIDMWK